MILFFNIKLDRKTKLQRPQQFQILNPIIIIITIPIVIFFLTIIKSRNQQIKER
ncbi:hypothetical protein HanIR_Chr08g0370971 [Helianthus annuus]|nr:hypothetical protein HanIR_Chr08g0370971 [Helianthus annuus]